MKFTQTGTFKENVLEELIDIKPQERIETSLFKRLNYIIGFIKKENPDIISDYIKNLTAKYQKLTNDDFLKGNSDKVDKIIADFKNLKKHPELTKASLNYYIHLLQLSDKSDWMKEETKVTNKAFLQGFLYPSYYFIETLAETIDREDAVKLFKKYVTQFLIDNKSPRRDSFVSLEDTVKKRLSGDITSSEWVVVHSILEDGKYAYKNENCTWVDAMKDLPDTQFKYLVCCYGDYEGARAYYHDSVVLTMEHTIAEGDPYCSRVLHDTRVDYDLTHPPREFWDNFKPGKEDEAKKYYKK